MADRSAIPDQGVLASVACSCFHEKDVWAARLARPDLLRAINHLATNVTEWTSKFDTMMCRLMGYIYQNTLHLSMIGWVGDSREQLFPHFFAGADFAGDVDTTVDKWLLLRHTRALHIVSHFGCDANGKHAFHIPPLKQNWWQRTSDDSCRDYWQEPYDALPCTYASRLCGMAT